MVPKRGTNSTIWQNSETLSKYFPLDNFIKYLKEKKTTTDNACAWVFLK